MVVRYITAVNRSFNNYCAAVRAVIYRAYCNSAPVIRVVVHWSFNYNSAGTNRSTNPGIYNYLCFGAFYGKHGYYYYGKNFKIFHGVENEVIFIIMFV
jgi:hypothetical protein